MKRIFLLLTGILLSAAGCYADCIMNSTEFYKAYLDVLLVNRAHQNKNNFTNEHKEFLMNENNPLDVRMAIVNAFDWDHEGDYYRQFLDYLKEKTNSRSDEEVIQNASAERLLTLAYLKAMKELDIEEDVLRLLSMIQQMPHEQTVSYLLPYVIMVTQYLDFEGQRDQIYPMIEQFILECPNQDMRPEALGYYMEYMNYYN